MQGDDFSHEAAVPGPLTSLIAAFLFQSVVFFFLSYDQLNFTKVNWKWLKWSLWRGTCHLVKYVDDQKKKRLKMERKILRCNLKFHA